MRNTQGRLKWVILKVNQGAWLTCSTGAPATTDDNTLGVGLGRAESAIALPPRLADTALAVPPTVALQAETTHQATITTKKRRDRALK